MGGLVKLLPALFGTINQFLSIQAPNLDVRLLQRKLPHELYLRNPNHLWTKARALQQLQKVLYVLYLAGLSHSVPFLLKSSCSVEFHHFFCRHEHSQKQEEAADDGARAALAVVAVEDSHSVGVALEEVSNLFAN